MAGLIQDAVRPQPGRAAYPEILSWRSRRVLAALEQRMKEVGLELHPDKTRIIY